MVTAGTGLRNSHTLCGTQGGKPSPHHHSGTWAGPSLHVPAIPNVCMLAGEGLPEVATVL